MALFDKCILASDIDGTLVENGFIAERNFKAIDFFRENGGTFVLSTGRSSSALSQVFGMLDKAKVGPCVVLNGGMIYDFTAEKPIYNTKLTELSKEYIHTVIDKMPKVGVEVHSNSLIFVLNKTYQTEWHEDYELLDREYVTFEDIKDRVWNKVLYTCDTHEEREKLAVLLGSIDNGDCSFVKTQVINEGVEHMYFEQMPQGTTKAKALCVLTKLLDIKKGGCFAIGDYYNDIEMLKAADVSAVPAEAPEEIKKIVNFVGGSCLDGAVADFIEYLSKNRR